jgi:hypothetical protein
MRPFPCLVVAWLLLAACAAPPSSTPPAFAPRDVVQVARWDVWSGNERIGRVEQFEIRDPTGPIGFYRVEDPEGRWVGHATASGRFSRRVPFEEEEQDLGIWSLERGVRELLEASGSVELRAIAVDADARRDR